jgi:enoyl-CoA hydratase/carnithine racemase
VPTLDRQDQVFVFEMGEGENRFHPDWLSSASALLDEVDNAEGPRALVTAGHGKFYSNGLDLEWLSANAEQAGEYLAAVQQLLARMLTFPMVTVAALPGHAFAAGAMFSLAHDFRVMRADRGYWCLPEADINLAFSPGMSALIRARLAPQVAHEAMVSSRRYGGNGALAAGIVDLALDENAVRGAAIELAAAHATKAGPVLATIKSRMYDDVLQALRAKDIHVG